MPVLSRVLGWCCELALAAAARSGGGCGGAADAAAGIRLGSRFAEALGDHRCSASDRRGLGISRARNRPSLCRTRAPGFSVSIVHCSLRSVCGSMEA